MTKRNYKKDNNKKFFADSKKIQYYPPITSGAVVKLDSNLKGMEINLYEAKNLVNSIQIDSKSKSDLEQLFESALSAISGSFLIIRQPINDILESQEGTEKISKKSLWITIISLIVTILSLIVTIISLLN